MKGWSGGRIVGGSGIRGKPAVRIESQWVGEDIGVLVHVDGGHRDGCLCEVSFLFWFAEG